MSVPVLESARLTLRAYRPEDAAALHPSLSDPDFMTWWSRPPLASLEETQAYLGRSDMTGWRGWYFAPHGGGPAMGWVSAGEKRQPGVSEIGYALAREHWGHGFAREAVSRVIDHLFDIDGYRRVFADTDPDNRASRKLLEALGFQLEGILRAEWETHIGIRDTALYGLLPADWAGRRAGTLAEDQSPAGAASAA